MTMPVRYGKRLRPAHPTEEAVSGNVTGISNSKPTGAVLPKHNALHTTQAHP